MLQDLRHRCWENCAPLHFAQEEVESALHTWWSVKSWLRAFLGLRQPTFSVRCWIGAIRPGALRSILGPFVAEAAQHLACPPTSFLPASLAYGHGPSLLSVGGPEHILGPKSYQVASARGQGSRNSLSHVHSVSGPPSKDSSVCGMP